MTVPRLLLVAGIALLFYLLGTRAGRRRSVQLRDSALQVWRSPESKKARGKLQKAGRTQRQEDRQGRSPLADKQTYAIPNCTSNRGKSVTRAFQTI